MAIDGQGEAALFGGDHLVAGGAAAFLDRGGLCRVGRLVVVGIAVSSTRADRERTCGIGRGQAQRQHADGSNSTDPRQGRVRAKRGGGEKPPIFRRRIPTRPLAIALASTLPSRGGMAVAPSVKKRQAPSSSAFTLTSASGVSTSTSAAVSVSATSATASG